LTPGTIADALAGVGEAPTWGLDGDGVGWNVDGVDPSGVRL
jgi:hypothetical protein